MEDVTRGMVTFWVALWHAGLGSLYVSPVINPLFRRWVVAFLTAGFPVHSFPEEEKELSGPQADPLIVAPV